MKGITEVLELLTTTVVTTTTSTTTPPITVDAELRGTSSPQISLPEGSLSRPTVTAMCRPRMWMQQLTEGQTGEPRREEDSSNKGLQLCKKPYLRIYLMNWVVSGEFYICLIFLE